MTSLSNIYERMKEIPSKLGINPSLPLPEQDPSVPKRKRKAIELEPETYIFGLYYRKELPKGAKEEAFQRVDDVHKVETETLLGYKVMSFNVKTDASQRVRMLMSEMINKRPNKEKIMSKRVKLESLGYSDV
uniref:Uncharacterized protein n=1 Tax=Tanacetum cinerariifolium TaxID=118510 RepID=A0A6L2M2D0_TANCI|nr:hypothetical protein [Tanacetum cinerariifolium]